MNMTFTISVPSGNIPLQHYAFALESNWSFNVGANIGHSLGILMVCVGTSALRAAAPVN